ncbi:2-amino-4-hydroxy-6-hydroxymethyldihydropteridine diphosphokinase [Jeotgalibacillus campisalis]|uniref:2-amino-4-hydroxy-6-hydroxymethyldihydropteridine diphosphokinase n=1 Tax=Jeotgalibacillus campisalis TaxID=220754 RepID=A0A0C2W8W9_9BACL|nr:2-amino-4-hydroxy-6-hydroxymethyldihydropteridine diphosphokinase [Jeotgalibacillus campisalis]KIL52483.1 2-amino-4-hydroxy-6-hydroxymethyldihydropteridine diphosphokinase [Jeotgalibacillus campisalis]
MTSLAYLSLGSNQGEPFVNLKEAVAQLDEIEGIQVSRVSSIYETDPVGVTEQNAFLNLAAQVETTLTPEELLIVCQTIENNLGRKRVVRWGPRTIDLDILMYNADQYRSKSLTIPHPRMHERSFVLVPLLELNPDLVHPELNVSLKQLQQTLMDQDGVRLWKKNHSNLLAGLRS